MMNFKISCEFYITEDGVECELFSAACDAFYGDDTSIR